MGKHRAQIDWSINAIRDETRRQKRYYQNRWRWFLKPRLKNKLRKAASIMANWFHN
jgi:hypothetical protein